MILNSLVFHPMQSRVKFWSLELGWSIEPNERDAGWLPRIGHPRPWHWSLETFTPGALHGHIRNRPPCWRVTCWCSGWHSLLSESFSPGTTQEWEKLPWKWILLVQLFQPQPLMSLPTEARTLGNSEVLSSLCIFQYWPTISVSGMKWFLLLSTKIWVRTYSDF